MKSTSLLVDLGACEKAKSSHNLCHEGVKGLGVPEDKDTRGNVCF